MNDNITLLLEDIEIILYVDYHNYETKRWDYRNAEMCLETHIKGIILRNYLY